jgi:hypothetical protein
MAEGADPKTGRSAARAVNACDDFPSELCPAAPRAVAMVEIESLCFVLRQTLNVAVSHPTDDERRAEKVQDLEPGGR